MVDGAVQGEVYIFVHGLQISVLKHSWVFKLSSYVILANIFMFQKLCKLMDGARNLQGR